MVYWSTKLSQMLHTCFYSVCINHKQVPLNKIYRQVSFYAIFFCAISLLAWLENLHHFSNLHDNFRFNAIRCSVTVAALIFCRRLAESDVTVKLLVTCMLGIRWLYNRAAHLVSFFTAVAFLIDTSEKCKSTSPSAIKVKNRRHR